MNGARTVVAVCGNGEAAAFAGWLFASAGADVRWVRGGAGPTDRLAARRLDHLRAGFGPADDHGAADVVLAQGAPAVEGRVVVDLATFGAAGPRSGWRGGELCAQASGGYLALCGAADGPPTRFAGAPFERLTGLAAYTWATAALRTGAPARIDLSVEDTVAANLEYALALYSWMGLRKRRGVTYPFAYPHDLYEAADGWVELTLATREPLLLLGLAVDAVELGAVEGYDTEYQRAVQRSAFDALVAPPLSLVTRAEYFERTTELRMPTGYVATPDELATLPPVVDRHALGPDGGPCSPLTPVDRRGTPPAPMAVVTAPAAAPLAGVRVLDLTLFYAGSTATRILAELGAEVVRVTSVQSPGRGLGLGLIADYEPGPDPWNGSCYYYDRIAGKQEVTLDLSTPDGMALFHRLAADSDVFVTNLSPRALVHLGLDAETLRTEHPRLIVSQVSGYGASGPWKDRPAVGPGVEALAGMAWINGQPGGPPTLPGTAIADAIAGYWAAAGVVALLAAGEGGFADVSMLEGCLAVVPDPALDPPAFSVTPRWGNDDGSGVLAGVHRCAGEDRWIALEVADEHEWQRCAAVLDIDADIDAACGRDARHAAVAAAVAGRVAEEVEAALQAAGVGAAAVRDARDLAVDAHLWARGTLGWVEQPRRGRRPMTRQLPGRSAELLTGIGAPAPDLGQDNDAVLGDRLGVSAEERARLEAAGVIGSVPTAADAWAAVLILDPTRTEAAGLTTGLDPDYRRTATEGSGGRRASPA